MNRTIENRSISFMDKINDILVVFLMTSIYLFSTNTKYNGYYKILTLMFIVLSIFKKVIKKQRFIISSYTIRSLIFSVFCLFSLIWSYKPNQDAIIVLFFITFVTFSLINYVTSQREFEKVLSGIIISGILLSSYLYVNVGLYTLIDNRFILEGYNSNDVGMKIAISCLACVYFISAGKKKYLNVIILLLLIPFVVFTNSKKAIILLIFGIVLYFIFKGENALKKIKYLLVGVIFLLIFWYAIFNVEWFYNNLGTRFETLLNQIFHGTGGSESDTLRMNFIQYGLDLAKVNPFFGYGIDNFKNYIGNFMNVETYAHNNYIELLVDVGFVGMFIYYSNYYYVLKKLVKQYKNNTQLTALPLVFIIIIPLIEFALVSYNEIFFNVIIALCYCVTRFKETNN